MSVVSPLNRLVANNQGRSFEFRERHLLPMLPFLLVDLSEVHQIRFRGT